MSPLADQLRRSLSGDPRPACLLLDFTKVSGSDFSAVNVLARFLRAANAAGVTVVLGAPSKQLRSGLQRNLPAPELAAVRIEPNTDHALERCEEILIEAWRAKAGAVDERRAALFERTADDLERHFERQIRFEDLMDALRDWLHPRRYAAGETVAGPETPGEGLQFLTSGRASAFGAEGARLLQYGPGDAIWPVASSDDGAPTVLADGACEALVLAPDARRWLEEHRERLALDLYRYLLAARFEAEAAARLPKGAPKPGPTTPP